MLELKPAGSVDAYTCSQIQFRLRVESLRQRNPSNGLPLGSWVKIPPDQRPFGDPWPRWLTLTPSSQIACSPFAEVTGLLSFTICSTHVHRPALAWTAGLLRRKFPQYRPSLETCMFIQ